MQRHFRVEVNVRQDSAVLALYGELDLASCPALEAEFERASAQKLVVVDLSALEFIDSSGLGLLVEAHDRAREDGRRFALVQGLGQVQRLLGLTGLADQLPMAETREELLGEN